MQAATPLEQRFAWSCIAMWMPAATILQLLFEISSELEKLSERDWRKVGGEFWRRRTGIFSVRPVRAGNLSGTALAGAMSPRMACILMSRVNGGAARKIYDTWKPMTETLALELRREGHRGLLYPSVRRPGGRCFAAFDPGIIQNVRPGASWRFAWNGSPEYSLHAL